MNAYGTIGEDLVAAARTLGSSPMAEALRAWVIPTLFHAQESAFAHAGDPLPALLAAMKRCTSHLRASVDAVAAPWQRNRVAEMSDVETVTGEHYGNLFAGFSAETYWDEPTELLRTRLARNELPTTFSGKRVLDAGCGGGRYTVAWSRLDAAHATGCDVSPRNIATAQARAREAGLTNIAYAEANVLELPFEEHAFDVAFSNGVLHHTRDWRAGIRELVRVLAPGGLGWLYLIERPGGLFWDMIDVLRDAVAGDSHDVARASLQLLGLPANRIFYMLDHVMVPINERIPSSEIEAALADAGAKDIRRLTRGADFDRVEQIYRGAPFAKEKFGVGENRYVFTH